MDSKELLAALKSEMLLAEARAIGAREAYEWKALCVSREDADFHCGEKILIRFKDGDKLAIFERIAWSKYEFMNYEGPALFGRFLLKSGKKSKTASPLCTILMVNSGLVTKIP